MGYVEERRRRMAANATIRPSAPARIDASRSSVEAPTVATLQSDAVAPPEFAPPPASRRAPASKSDSLPSGGSVIFGGGPAAASGGRVPESGRAPASGGGGAGHTLAAAADDR